MVEKQPVELHDHVFVPCNLVSLEDAPRGNHSWPYRVHSCRRPLCLDERAAVEAVAALAMPLATRLPGCLYTPFQPFQVDLTPDWGAAR